MKQRFIKKYTEVISRHGYSSLDIAKEIQVLSDKFKKEASFADAIWSLFGKATRLLATQNPIDLYSLSTIYFDKSLFLAESGEDPTPALEEAHKYKLLTLQKNFMKVRVSCNMLGCDGCRKFSEKIYSIKDALDKKILPNQNCSSFHFKTSKHPLCTCYFVAAV
jgi:hypothetical protein